MPLTPQEEQELAQLEAEEAQASGGLTPDEARELAELEAQEAQTVPAPAPAPEVPSTRLSASGLGQATKSAIGGVSTFAANDLTGGALGKFQDALGTGVDLALKASGNLLTPEGTENPYKDTSVSELMAQNEAKRTGDMTALRKAAPLAFDGARVLSSLAVPAKTMGQVGTQALVEGYGRSDKKGLDALGDMAENVAWATAPAALLKVGGAGLDKAKDFLSKTQYGEAFNRGSNVQKFTDETVQTDLANRVGEAIKKRMGKETADSAAAKNAFVEMFGATPVESAHIASRVEGDLARLPKLKTGAGDIGAVVGKEAEQLNQYVDLLKEPRTAEELYAIWDDIKRIVDYNDNNKINSQFNNELKAIQGEIKAQLHALSPDLAAADARMSHIADQAQHLTSAKDARTAESALSTLGNRNKGNRRNAVDEMLKDNPELLQEIDDFRTYKAFNREGGSGSGVGLRNLTGMGVGSVLGGAIGGPAGYTVGGLVGASLAHGPNQRAILTKAGDMTQRLTARLPSLPPKYQTVLREAAARGGNALATTHFILSQTDPEYHSLTQDDSE